MKEVLRNVKNIGNDKKWKNSKKYYELLWTVKKCKNSKKWNKYKNY